MTTDPHKYYIGSKPISCCLTPGIRLWSNGLPLKADTYKSCTNFCTYCFARSMTAAMVERRGVKYNPRIARTMEVNKIARWFAKAQTEPKGWMYWAMRSQYMIELGTMSEAFQEPDLEMRITWNFLQLTAAYKMPLLINTKGNLLIQNQSYFDLIANYPAPVIVSLSMISNIDDNTEKLEPGAPLQSERLKLIERLTEAGVPTIVYVAPFIVGITDRDLEGLTRSLIDAGAVSAHVRNFYIAGKLRHQQNWKNYLEKYRDYFVRDGHVMKVKADYLERAYLTMQQTADDIDPRFRVVGLKSHWFDLNPVHGKMAMDWLPKPFKDSIIDFTAIPIMRKIREKIDEPQLLLWDQIGYKQDLVNAPVAIPTSGGVGQEEGWLLRGCSASVGGKERPRGTLNWIDGWEWVKQSLWNGINEIAEIPGFIEGINYIYPVMDEGERVLHNDVDRVYAYVPDSAADELLAHDPDLNIMYVPWSSAQSLPTPKRAGGTEDKFWDVDESEVYPLAGRWSE